MDVVAKPTVRVKPIPKSTSTATATATSTSTSTATRARPTVKPKTPVVTTTVVEDDEDLLAFPLYDLRKTAGLSSEDISIVNEGIIDMLDQLIEYANKQKATAVGADKAQHSRRINSFIKAKDAIKDFKREITSGSQAQRDIPGVGKGIAQRIQEYLTTGTLAELENAVSPQARIIMELCTVTGIGEEKAKTLVKDHQVSSVTDLIDKYHRGILSVSKNQLTHHIAVGLQYYRDLQQRMPWNEADDLANILTRLIHQFDPNLIVQVCGSYRRRCATCGDIDVLISREDFESDEQLKEHSSLPNIVTMLEKEGLLCGHLTTKGKTKYMGICKLSPISIGRRIDIRCINYHSLGAAMLYFTGSGKFNKIMRYHANKRGYTLNEYGLFRYLGGVKGEEIAAPTERDIFRILNFVYLEPTEREF